MNAESAWGNKIAKFLRLSYNTSMCEYLFHSATLQCPVHWTRNKHGFRGFLEARCPSAAGSVLHTLCSTAVPPTRPPSFSLATRPLTLLYIIFIIVPIINSTHCEENQRVAGLPTRIQWGSQGASEACLGTRGRKRIECPLSKQHTQKDLCSVGQKQSGVKRAFLSEVERTLECCTTWAGTWMNQRYNEILRR